MRTNRRQFCKDHSWNLLGGFWRTWRRSQGTRYSVRVGYPCLILAALILLASGFMFGCGGGSHAAATTPPAPPSLPSPSSLPASCTTAATVGTYSCGPITVSGGQAPFTWDGTHAPNHLPAGLMLSVSTDTTTATITGTVKGQQATAAVSSFVPFAAATTTASVQITVTSSTGQSATLSFSITLSISPLALNTSPFPAATLGTAYSQAASASGGLQPYAWSVIAGSLPPGLNVDAASGTISGTPTATGTFVFTLQVSDAESPAAMLSSGFTITVSTSSTVNCTGVNLSINLCGTYWVGIGGFVGTTGPALMAASFVADGSNHVVSGVQDINSVSGGQANVAITGGTYSVGGDGRGVLTLIDSNGVSRTFRFVLESTNNKGIGAIEEFDASGTLAAGVLAGPSTPGAIAANTPFAVRLGGVNGAGKRTGMLGEFQAGKNGCDGTAGSLSSLTGETFVINVAGTVSNVTFTGSCTAPDSKTGRGTATITLISSPFTNTTLNFVFYAVSILSNKGAAVGVAMLLGEADAIAANQPILVGLAQQISLPATGGLTNCGAPAACILAGVGTTDGTITGHNVALLVRAVATGTTTAGTVAGILDENSGGTITSAGVWPYTAYTTDANGVGTITGTGQPTIHFLADGNWMDESISVITGDANVQNATTIESPGAPYIMGEAIGTSGVGATPLVPHVVGVVTPAGAVAGPGTFSGTMDVGSNPPATVAGSGTYGAIDSTTGRATGTANFTTGGAKTNIVIYANRRRRFSVLDVQSSDPYLLGARLR